jgi:hypothetical protein
VYALKGAGFMLSMLIQTMSNMFHFTNATRMSEVAAFRHTLNRFNVFVWLLFVVNGAAMAVFCRNDETFFPTLVMYCLLVDVVFFICVFFTYKFTNSLIKTVQAPNRHQVKGNGNSEMEAVAERLKIMKKYWLFLGVSMMLTQAGIFGAFAALHAIPFSWALIHLPMLVACVFAPLAVTALFANTRIRSANKNI